MTLECSPLPCTTFHYLSLPLTKRKKQLQVVTARALNQESGVTHWLYDLENWSQLCTHWLYDLEQSHFKRKGLIIACGPTMCPALGYGLRIHLIIKPLPHHYKELW